jgi:hypothetical protein
MTRAIMAVRNKERGLLRASKLGLYEVPKLTLKGQFKGRDQHIEKVVIFELVGRMSCP